MMKKKERKKEKNRCKRITTCVIIKITIYSKKKERSRVLRSFLNIKINGH